MIKNEEAWHCLVIGSRALNLCGHIHICLKILSWKVIICWCFGSSLDLLYRETQSLILCLELGSIYPQSSINVCNYCSYLEDCEVGGGGQDAQLLLWFHVAGGRSCRWQVWNSWRILVQYIVKAPVSPAYCLTLLEPTPFLPSQHPYLFIYYLFVFFFHSTNI